MFFYVLLASSNFTCNSATDHKEFDAGFTSDTSGPAAIKFAMWRGDLAKNLGRTGSSVTGLDSILTRWYQTQFYYLLPSFRSSIPDNRRCNPESWLHSVRGNRQEFIDVKEQVWRQGPLSSILYDFIQPRVLQILSAVSGLLAFLQRHILEPGYKNDLL